MFHLRVGKVIDCDRGLGLQSFFREPIVSIDGDDPLRSLKSTFEPLPSLHKVNRLTDAVMLALCQSVEGERTLQLTRRQK